MFNAAKAVRLRKPSLLKLFSTSTEEIVIPKRIPRGPTDILRALETTISRDPTAAHYKYHDDPYLIPMSNIGKRTFALAQEAGRKAAHWVRSQHPEYFQHREAEPFVEAFGPPMIYNEKSEVGVEDLKRCLEMVQISDAKLIYKLLKERNLEVGKELEQRLLEALCYQNGEDVLNEEFIEERWFRHATTRRREKAHKTWKDGELAEEIFVSLENPTGETYAALIQGMAKYLQVNRAYQLFEEAIEKKISLSTNTYNSIISIASSLKEEYPLRWELVVNLLLQMKQNKLTPNLGTLNAALSILSSINNQKISKPHTLQILAEFKRLGIEPSLASWTYVLEIFCTERGPKSYVLNDILNQIEHKNYTIRDLRDVNFFFRAMEICRHHLNDVEIAERLNAYLHKGNNYDLIGDSYKESIYYRNYFCLLCAHLPIGEFMDTVYARLIPHIYIPEPGVMEEIMKQVDLNDAIEYIPKLWSDVVVFDHLEREAIIESFSKIMVKSATVKEDLKEKFAVIAWDIFARLNVRNEKKMNKFIFTGELIGNILIVLLRNKQLENAYKVFEFLVKEQHVVVGLPEFEALSLLVDSSIENKLPSRAIDCIQYCQDSGYPETKKLARKITQQMTLDADYTARLSGIIGDLELLNIDE